MERDSAALRYVVPYRYGVTVLNMNTASPRILVVSSLNLGVNLQLHNCL
jgi:hypothetical protein